MSDPHVIYTHEFTKKTPMKIYFDLSKTWLIILPSSVPPSLYIIDQWNQLEQELAVCLISYNQQISECLKLIKSC